MDIFYELFGGVLPDEDIRNMIFLRNNGMLRASYKGDPKLKPNNEQLEVFSEVMKDVYRLAEIDTDLKVIPPDITPDTAFRIHAEAPIGMSFPDTAFRIHAEAPIGMSFSFESLEILKRILPKVSLFGFGIKDEELKTNYEGQVETISFEFVIPDVYTYPFDE